MITLCTFRSKEESVYSRTLNATYYQRNREIGKEYKKMTNEFNINF